MIRLWSPWVQPDSDKKDDATLHPYVRVESFGGGNGVDDSAAFTSALADGRVIALNDNTTYRVKNVDIPLDSPCPGIVSLGGQARIVPPDDYVKADYFFLVGKETGFAFENIFFDMPLNLDPFMDYRFNRAIWLAPEPSKRGRNYRVENCTFSGGLTALSGGGYIIEDSRFTDNHISGTLGDGFSFNAVINVEISDNIFENSGIVVPGGVVGTSGAIRTGTPTQLDSSLNLTIARNVITRCSVATAQSAIDCYSGAARNIRITDNILSYNGHGVELKTTIWDRPDPMPPGASDVYEDNVIANNTIRLFSDRSTSGIKLFHSVAGASKGKAANVKIAGNIISSTGDVAPSAFGHNAISVQGHDNVLIDSNQIFNCGRGIQVGGNGPVGNVSDVVVISNNLIDTVEMAVQTNSGTVNQLYIRNNPLLRSAAVTPTSTIILSFPGTDIEISGNRIENLAPGEYALDLRAIDNVRVTDNTIISNGTGIFLSTSGLNGVRIRDNEIISTTGPAVDVRFGTAIEVQGNTVDVPAASRTVSGTVSFTAANNIRGLADASPVSTGGSLGDIFLDSTAATAGWRCTTAHATAATWTVI